MGWWHLQDSEGWFLVMGGDSSTRSHENLQTNREKLWNGWNGVSLLIGAWRWWGIWTSRRLLGNWEHDGWIRESVFWSASVDQNIWISIEICMVETWLKSTGALRAPRSLWRCKGWSSNLPHWPAPRKDAKNGLTTQQLPEMAAHNDHVSLYNLYHFTSFHICP